MSSPREEDVFIRPSSKEIRSQWNKIFSDPLINLGKLRSRSLDKAGLGPEGANGGVTLRSLYWRFYHNLLPPPTSLDLFPPAVETTRETYNIHRRRYLIAPDGRWASDCSGFQESLDSPNQPLSPNPSSPNPTSPLQGNEGWDPLSLSTSSPWKTWFAHTELRATIRQDVDRTFPDMPYFQLERVQRCMTTALFIFSVLNPDVGYRQGMHELFACCLLAVDRDSLTVGQGSTVKEEAMLRTLDRRYIEHDAFELFAAVMKNGKAFYEWRAEEGPPIRSKSPTAPQAPIIIRCSNLHSSILRKIDPQLWEKLESEGVEAQIWAIRWLRLIFTRELPFNIAMRLWDGIFAEDPGLQLLDFVCVAMLLLIRNELIEGDYPAILTNLLHYPAPSPTYPFEPFMILAQALYLRDELSPAAGVEIVLQNQDLLNIKAAPFRGDIDGPATSQAESRSNGRGGSFNAGRSRMQKSGGMGGIAQGLFERAQAAGLDKAFLSTVSDIRKNIPDSAYSYLPNLPFSPAQSPGPQSPSNAFSSIPSSSRPARSFFHSPSQSHTNTRPRPPLRSRPSMDSQTSEMSVKTVKDAEREMAELRLAMLGMGKAMLEWLDVVKNKDQSTTEGSDGERDAAWSGLERVRDTLIDAAGKDVDDIVKEWGWHEGLEAPSSRSTTPAPDTEPQAPVIAPAVATASQVPEPDRDPLSVKTGPGHMEFEDATPTPASVSVMPTTPMFPGRPSGARTSLTPPSRAGSSRTAGAPNTTRQSPSELANGQSRMSVVSGLPRVSQSAPLTSNGAFARHQQVEERRPSTAGLGISSSSRGVKSTRDPLADSSAAASSDPLAGLGVTSREDKRLSASTVKAKGRNSGGVDPLLGIDLK
ncbi:hypothetical protein L202_05924 [Cryptococcus amylolentus CBS 6039]|uniref:Rab-GAP TBC domain-containing protein n=1 Tax=Cryptococcus amylolentus CBS 6039 TaxID=1295533 RepID=A0A1E3HHW6_9TREE|nr:hypothetical protein L202_05924 [Cryptococcus amylolentus CBS 6039]ODN75943.1 hypothetical protein L202_05924 [Cryptococcus amylolentus CBS 6039]